MNSALPIVRQQHLVKLEPFCRCLAEALGKSGLREEECLSAFRDAVSAECVSCGMQVSGQELFALSQPPSAEGSTVKIGRLRKGDCARQGCDSYYYRLTFQPFGKIDWCKLLDQLLPVASQPSISEPLPFLPRLGKDFSLRQLFPRQVFYAVGLLLMVLLLRQLYAGGRIPLVREPEQFQVDVGPEEPAD